MKLLRHVWTDIRGGDNIDTYATILVAVALAVATLLGVNTSKWIAPTTLAVLALLAVSALKTRHSIIPQLRDITLPPPPTLLHRSQLPPLRERGRGASQI